MKRRFLMTPIYLAVVLAVLAGGCASLGGADPVVVRAEDTLVNSLTVYEAVMKFHYASGATKSPEVHNLLEGYRKAFPKAWRTLWQLKETYVAAKGGDPAALKLATADLNAMVATMLKYVADEDKPVPIEMIYVPKTGGK